MHAPSDALQRIPDLPHPLTFQMPLVQLQLDHLLVLTQWATTMWMVGQNQFSRFSTLLGGGAPIDA